VPTHGTESAAAQTCGIPSPRPTERLLTLDAEQFPNRVHILYAIGEVELVTTPMLRAALDGQLTARPHTLIVDLSGVRFLAACGLAALEAAAHTARRHHGALCMVATASAVLRPMRILALDQVIPVHGTLEQALRCTVTVGLSR